MAATANAAIYCPECGEMRVNIFNSRYSVCPSGHGKLWPKLSRSEIAAAGNSRARSRSRPGEIRPRLASEMFQAGE